MMSGGRVIVEALRAHGVKHIFCVAGESYLPVLDAVLDYPNIQVITCRHESEAAFMAESYAHLTGTPGVLFVTRGPGACNASIGIHTAHQSSAPVIMFVGLIRTEDRDRHAFQEFDLPAMFGGLAKWARVIDTPGRIADYVTYGFNAATSGRPGPVVLGLPEDILSQDIQAPLIKTVRPHMMDVSKATLGEVQHALEAARQPLIVVGGSLWSDQACADLQAFAAQAGIPVMCGLRRQDLYDHSDPHYAGDMGFGANPALVQRVQEADTILIIGARINEITAQGYTLFRQAGQTLIHIYPGAEEFGRACMPDIAIPVPPGPALAALKNIRLDKTRRQDWAQQARADYLNWVSVPGSRRSDWQGADVTQIFARLRDVLPKNAVITSDAGNANAWCHRYLRFGRPGRALAPVSGAMGYAVPAAVMSSIVKPDRLSLAICGDGGFMMSGHALATAMHHGGKPIIFVFNNNMYGTIRMHQDMTYPDRPHTGKQGGTVLTNPDFVQYGKSFGGFAAQITHEDQFDSVWDAAIQAKGMALIEVVMDSRQISTGSAL